MIVSQDGVISTSDDSVLHMSWWDERDGWQTCTVPAQYHKDAEGNALTCREASKYATMKPGQRVMKRVAPPPEWKGPVNLPR